MTLVNPQNTLRKKHPATKQKGHVFCRGTLPNGHTMCSKGLEMRGPAATGQGLEGLGILFDLLGHVVFSR